ncbi:hypothetical protein FisN_21Lh058 [Fistulifera solaris]|uniref:Uncharacterized protein n=1 Tax=Fistulifera solaris TaxID=1519565 RepID=A0A1Z5KJW5_FISSO|nr:hypothetical protein FisN_21Lh058 [Fistulifera solaris]|eukprot:GAX26593.1 hypothetical protein FisN_21Lh058 [Fistulifera solaris]
MVSTIFSQKWSLLAVLLAASASSVSAVVGYDESSIERENLFLPGPIGNTKLPLGLCDEIRRRPNCSGPERDGCNCANSEWQCEDGFDSLTLCTGSSGVQGECAVSIEGNPYCTGGNTGQCNGECKSSSDCGGGADEVCIWVGKTFRTDCVQKTDYFCRESFICVKLL